MMKFLHLNDDAIQSVLCFLHLHECVVMQRTSKGCRDHADSYLAHALQEIYAHAPLLVTLAPSSDQQTPHPAISQLFYPLHKVKQKAVEHSVYVPARASGPLRLQFTYADDNATPEWIDEDDFNMIAAFDAKIELVCGHPSDLPSSSLQLVLAPKYPFHHFLVDNLPDIGADERSSTIVSDVIKPQSDMDPAQGVTRHIFWCTGRRRQTENEMEEDQVDHDLTREEKEVEKSMQTYVYDDAFSDRLHGFSRVPHYIPIEGHELEVHEVFFNNVWWTRLFHPALRTSFLRLIVYKKYIAELGQMSRVLSSFGLNSEAILFAPEVSVWWYRVIASTQTRSKVLAALKELDKTMHTMVRVAQRSFLACVQEGLSNLPTTTPNPATAPASIIALLSKISEA